MKRRLNKYLMLIGTVILTLAILVPTVAAYEGHAVDIRVHVKGDIKPTRTPGYWKNHVQAAQWVFTNRLGGYIDMGWPAPIANMNSLVDIFWVQTENTPGDNGGGPPTLCEIKQDAAVHVLAAILNDASPNGMPMPVTMGTIYSIMSGTDKEAIKNLQTLLDEYNNKYDEDEFDCLSLEIPGGIENISEPQIAQQMAGTTNFASCP